MEKYENTVSEQDSNETISEKHGRINIFQRDIHFYLLIQECKDVLEDFQKSFLSVQI